MRVNLRVPYEDKDEAKRLGAWWDAKLRVWYVKNREDLTPFAKWFSEAHAQPVADKKAPQTKAGVFVACTSKLLPICDCSGPPWEDCWHTLSAEQAS